MSTDRPATRNWFSFQFSLASLVFMSVMAGVLFLANFRENENWWLRYAPVNPYYGDPTTRHLSTFHTKGAIGYGWPYLVCGASEYGEDANWSWVGLCANIVIGGAILLVLGSFFEVAWRWIRKKAPFQPSWREWLVLAVFVSAFVTLNGWPRNVNVALSGTFLVDVHSARGWPWPWYSERIADEVPPDVGRSLPVRSGFHAGQFDGACLLFDSLLSAVFCGLLIGFLIWLRLRRVQE